MGKTLTCNRYPVDAFDVATASILLSGRQSTGNVPSVIVPSNLGIGNSPSEFPVIVTIPDFFLYLAFDPRLIHPVSSNLLINSDATG